jgi:hypothetical protein
MARSCRAKCAWIDGINAQGKARDSQNMQSSHIRCLELKNKEKPCQGQGKKQCGWEWMKT